MGVVEVFLSSAFGGVKFRKQRKKFNRYILHKTFYHYQVSEMFPFRSGQMIQIFQKKIRPAKITQQEHIHL